MNLEPYKTLIRERAGLEFNGIAEKPLLDAIRQRCGHYPGIETDGYFDKLARDGDEFDELVSLLTINETYFFREPSQIELFVRSLAPRLLAARPGGESLRILSAGSSTGEEPYSLAIALAEEYGESAASRFEIVAADIDKAALRKARLACYQDWSFRSMPPGLRERHFDRLAAGSGWQLKEKRRRMVQIEHLNLFDPLRGADACRFDAIFFRNVSIYFGVEQRRRVQELLRQMLRPGGILMIGIAETLANDLGVFALAEEQGLFYFTAPDSAGRGASPKPEPAQCQPEPTVAWDKPPTPPARQAESPDLPALVALIRDKRLDEAAFRLGLALAADPSMPELLLLRAYCHLQAHELDDAARFARQALELSSWSVDACVILGLVARQRGDGAEALGWFKQAVYDRNDCWPAQYYLAELHRAEGAGERAGRAYRTVLQLLAADGTVATGLQIIPLDLPASELRFLCEHQLAKMSDGGKVRHGA